jgi:Mg2+ and Co2+ transporter CorA
MMSMSLNIPLMHSPNAFWIHGGIMALIALATIYIFKRKNWI